MSKMVYRRGDEVEVKIKGSIFYLIIENSIVDEMDPVTGDSVIHYVATDGTHFTDDQVL